MSKSAMSAKSGSQAGAVCRLVLTLSIAVVPLAGHSAPTTVERAALKASIERPETEVLSARLKGLMRPGAADWGQAKALLESSNLDAPAREYLLGAFLYHARSSEPDGAATAFVSSLATYQSEVHVWHEEGPLPIEAFPVADIAQGTLRVWATESARKAAEGGFREGSYASLNHLRTPGSPDYAGTLLALKSARPLQVSAAKAWLLQNTGSDAYEAKGIVALRTNDQALVVMLLGDDRGAASTSLVRTVSAHFDADASFEILRAATANPALASVAITEIEKLRGSVSARAVDEFLLQLLGEPASGGTAAAMIARRGDTSVLARVADLLTDRSSAASLQARAALTLRLSNTQFSRSALETASRGGGIRDHHLRTEILKWLAN